ncbi:MAG TPA: DUF3866 family protein [Solirubrobacteraceae bacterium]|jgi:hypothetical protein
MLQPRRATVLKADPADGAEQQMEVRPGDPAGAAPADAGGQPVEEQEGWQLTLPFGGVVAVLALHGQLPALAWAFAQAAPGARLGYVQTAGGALAGGRSQEVRALRAQGLLAGHITAGSTFGGEGEALTTAGALYHGLRALGWDAAVCGPGPGAAAHGSQLGHGGLAALDSAHTALALGCPTLLVPRMSSGGSHARQRGISRDTLTVLDLLLVPVTVALPAGLRSPVGADLRAGLGAVFGATRSAPAQLELDVARPARVARHDWRRAPVDLPGFAAGGLPAHAAGPAPTEDPLFVGTALAAGAALAELAAECRGRRPAERHEPHELHELHEHHQDSEGALA